MCEEPKIQPENGILSDGKRYVVSDLVDGGEEVHGGPDSPMKAVKVRKGMQNHIENDNRGTWDIPADAVDVRFTEVSIDGELEAGLLRVAADPRRRFLSGVLSARFTHELCLTVIPKPTTRHIQGHVYAHLYREWYVLHHKRVREERMTTSSR